MLHISYSSLSIAQWKIGAVNSDESKPGLLFQCSRITGLPWSGKIREKQ